ncbi:hypothetical protein SCHPADRAFT_943563 [Schizopora paradoxa]|uniref:Uncharacterized protein n=1 Tax=Schizopora paradoxa TaxID=27342 RepID=A0A0H2RCJ1_9AGAM|nr:hypothetical protein SCHPADRAFT_943563 [Schizopora paradoxa]
MSRLTNLVLSFRNFQAGVFDIRNLQLPLLIACDITCDSEPLGLGLTEFVKNHSGLFRLHLSFIESVTPEFPSPFLPEKISKIQNLKLSADNSLTIGTWLREWGESTEEARVWRPQLEHFSIGKLRSLAFLDYYVKPFGAQLRRLDLEIRNEGAVINDDFYNLLTLFTALIELSITTNAPPSSTMLVIQASSHLRKTLRACKDCTSLRAMHFYDKPAQSLEPYHLKNLHPVPPSLQFISWGNWRGTTTFRIIHDRVSRKARAEECEVPPHPTGIIYDWTSENTFRHLFD